MLCCSLEKLVCMLFNQSLETLCRLPTLPVFTHDVGLHLFLTMNRFPTGQTVSCFTPVNDKNTVTGFVDEHVFQLCHFKRTIAAIAERAERLRRIIEYNRGHPSFVIAYNHVACENCNPMLRGFSHVVDSRGCRFDGIGYVFLGLL